MASLRGQRHLYGIALLSDRLRLISHILSACAGATAILVSEFAKVGLLVVRRGVLKGVEHGLCVCGGVIMEREW